MSSGKDMGYVVRRSTARLLALLFVLSTIAQSSKAEERSSRSPSFRQLVDLPQVSRPRISPDGEGVVYRVRSADWEENLYDTEIWMARRGQQPFQLTHTEGGSSNYPLWSPDGKWISFWADRGDGMQIWLISPGGGEARQLTSIKGLQDFEWAPDGRRMGVLILDPESEERKKRREAFGRFESIGEAGRRTHLWVLDVEGALASGEAARLPDFEANGSSGIGVGAAHFFQRLTGGSAFTIGEFEWSPDGTRIAFHHKPEPSDPTEAHDLSVLDVANRERRTLVTQPGKDGSAIWSPDGKWILFYTANGSWNTYRNFELAKIPAEGGEWMILTSGFDENPNPYNSLTHRWLPDGIRFIGRLGTHRQVFRLDPDSGTVGSFVQHPTWVSDVDYTPDGREMVFIAEGKNTLPEVYRCSGECKEIRRITSMTEGTAGWPLGSRDVIEWTSRDDTRVEGVLYKPKGVEPGRRYPLLVVVHGGPNLTSYPGLVYNYVYPVEQWLARGALVLMPNYRGSAGYGKVFRSLNVRNIGTAYSWDVMSGVDHLVNSGLADPERLGIMGWSHGGYITSFVLTQTNRFRAASVGAAQIDFRLDYATSDVPLNPRQYLGATPWEDPQIYDASSSITHVKNVKTPTLIQHGDADRRVVTANSFELYRALQDSGVETKFVLYKGFGHSINRPKEQLAVRWHNWQWFAKYLWGESVQLPPKEGEEKILPLR